MENYKIYIIKNDINDRVYIGSTLNTLEYRFRGHCTQKKSELDRDIIKFGKEHFWIELLEDGMIDESSVDEKENYYICQYDAINNGYNDRNAGSYSSRRKTTRYKDLSGMRFGKLTVIEENGRGNDGINWLCRCDCGNLHVVSGHALKRNSRGIRSCGCAQQEQIKKIARQNKAPYDTKERLYVVWKGIRSRCNNPNHTSYFRYGGRGIKLCNEWNDYEKFRQWAYSNGYDESADYQQCTIDRIDVNGDYCPENCRWSSASEQNLNQRDTTLIEHDGKQMTLCQWADYLHVRRSVFLNRKGRGWDAEKILTTPVGSYEWGSHCRKPVRCVETGQVFPSRADAAIFASVPASNITTAISKPTKTAGGYHWENAD